MRFGLDSGSVHYFFNGVASPFCRAASSHALCRLIPENKLRPLLFTIISIFMSVMGCTKSPGKQAGKRCSLGMKNIGKPCAGKPHARFDEGALRRQVSGTRSSCVRRGVCEKGQENYEISALLYPIALVHEMVTRILEVL